MVELKTLKDFEGTIGNACYFHKKEAEPTLEYDKVIIVKELREEAIKEIKYLYSVGRCEIIGVEDSEIVGAIAYIKWKFSIEEIDLK